MKKIFLLLLVTFISLFTLTGCSASFDSYFSALDNVRYQENIVYTKKTISEYETSDSLRTSVTTYTYTFSDNFAIITEEEENKVKSPSNSAESYDYSETIYDFENGFVYESNGKSGEYTQRTFTTSYSSLYSSRISIDEVSMLFFKGDITNKVEKEDEGYSYSAKLSGSSKKLTSKITAIFKQDDFKSLNESIETFNFKTTKISVPKDSKITSWA